MTPNCVAEVAPNNSAFYKQASSRLHWENLASSDFHTPSLWGTGGTVHVGTSMRDRLTHRLFAPDRIRALERSEPPVVLSASLLRPRAPGRSLGRVRRQQRAKGPASST